MSYKSCSMDMARYKMARYSLFHSWRSAVSSLTATRNRSRMMLNSRFCISTHCACVALNVLLSLIWFLILLFTFIAPLPCTFICALTFVESRNATSAASNRLDNLLKFIRACSIVIRAHRDGRTPIATSRITTELTPIGLARAEASYNTAAL